MQGSKNLKQVEFDEASKAKKSRFIEINSLKIQAFFFQNHAKTCATYICYSTHYFPFLKEHCVCLFFGGTIIELQ